MKSPSNAIVLGVLMTIAASGGLLAAGTRVVADISTDGSVDVDLIAEGVKKALIMDFDCTLAARHLFKSTHWPDSQGDKWRGLAVAAGFFNKGDATCSPVKQCPLFEDRNQAKLKEFAEWIMGGQPRIKLLKQWFTDLKAKGVKIEISSASEGSWVRKILDLAGLAQLDRIHAYADDYRSVNVWTPKDNITEIDRLFWSKRPWVDANRANQVLFVDDDVRSYGQQCEVCFPNTLFDLEKDAGSKVQGGLDQAMMQAILKYFSQDQTKFFSNFLEIILRPEIQKLFS